MHGTDFLLIFNYSDFTNRRDVCSHNFLKCVFKHLEVLLPARAAVYNNTLFSYSGYFLYYLLEIFSIVKSKLELI